MDFDDAERMAPAQQFELTRAHAAGEPITLKFVSFQHVTHLTVGIALVLAFFCLLISLAPTRHNIP